MFLSRIQGYVQMILNDQIIFRSEFDHSGVLFDPDSGNVVGVNPVGGIVWECLAENLHFNAIISRLRELVDNLPSEEVLISDVKVFLADLQQRGFLSK